MKNKRQRICDIGEWIYETSGVDENGIDKSGEKQEHILAMYKTLNELLKLKEDE